MSQARLDVALVARGLARSRTQAQALVRDGLVRVDGTVVSRPATLVERTTVLEVTGAGSAEGSAWIQRGWVGRGALKLDHGLTRWEPAGLRVAGRRCLDVGASTGGFTQVLLERGAEHVVALDVGHEQLDPSLREDPRVRDLAGTSVRDVSPADVGPVGLVVADLSFISLRVVLPVLPRLCEPGADLVLLVKPQFEVGRDALGRTGVVRSVQQRATVLADLEQHAVGAGLAPVDLVRSPVTGSSGNIEYLWWLRRCPTGMMDWSDPVRLRARRAELRDEEEDE